jgi:ABC-2 type transport system ATP-binding protein
MTDYAIETNGLSVYYGRHRGILDVDLRVEKGVVFGFLGPNGAGKTTTQRVLMDVIRPTAGEARIFGQDCQKEGVAARERVGYLPGELSLYENMTARRFFKMYYSLQKSNDDPRHWQTLADRLELDTSRKIREYSRGNKQKVGVVAAFMNRPELLILDEPTTGLDPLVQQTVMELVREANRGGATVFFSSHILPEVQAVCDRVGIIRDGRLVATERVEDLTRQQFKRIRFSFATQPPADAFAQYKVTETARDEQGITLEIRDRRLDKVMEMAASFGIVDVETIPVSLEEIFLAYYGKGKGGRDA